MVEPVPALLPRAPIPPGLVVVRYPDRWSADRARKLLRELEAAFTPRSTFMLIPANTDSVTCESISAPEANLRRCAHCRRIRTDTDRTCPGCGSTQIEAR